MYLTLFLKLYLTLNVSLCCQSCVCDSKSCNVARSFGPSPLAFLAFLIVFCTAPESSPSALVSLFRCIRQERIYIRGSVRPSARPSIGRLVRYACAKTVFLGCFWPRWVPLLNRIIDMHVLRASFPPFCFICLFIHRSLHLGPEASLPGRACFVFCFVFFRT